MSYRSTKLLLLACCLCNLSWPANTVRADLIIDLDVMVTEEDGLFRYDYTLANSIQNSVGLDIFFLTVGRGDHLVDIMAPPNWDWLYTPDAEPANLQMAWFANDPAANFEIKPGQQLSGFSISSPLGPDEEEFGYTIGKLTLDQTDFVDLTAGSVIVPLILPCDVDGDGDWRS